MESKWGTRRMWSSCLCTTRAPTSHWRGSWISKGMRGTPKQLGRTWDEEKWRQDRPVPLRGGWGRGRDPTPRGEKGGTVGRTEDKKGEWPAFPLLMWAPGSLVRSRA